MVAVPAHTARDVQRNLREERQHRRNFIGYDLRRVVVAVIEQRDALIFIHRRIAQRKFRTAHRVRLHPDTEHLRFHTRLHKVKIERLRENLVERLFIQHARRHAVGGNIFQSVARPDVHDARLTELLRQILRNADTRLAVLHPEFARLRVRARERQRVALRVRKIRRVKIAAEPALLTELHPRRKVLRLQLISVHPTAVFFGEDRVARV